MEGLNPVYALALGALWTSGRDLPGFDKTADVDRYRLQTFCGGPRQPRDFPQYLRDGGAREAARALHNLGFPLSDIGQALATAPDASGALGSARRSELEPLLMLEPELAPIIGRDCFPTAGDVVELGEEWQGLERVGLQGHARTFRAGLTCANPRASWHYGRDSHVVSMGSGGPASMLYLDLREAVDTGETVPFRVWSFESAPRAHTGVQWLRKVPLWRVPSAEWLDYTEAEQLRAA